MQRERQTGGLTPAQIEQRKNTIGASEIYEVMTRPHRLWRSKVHGERRFTGKEDFIRLGHLFEPPVRRSYERETSTPIIGSGTWSPEGIVPCSFVHPVDRWMSFTPDGIPCTDRGVMAVSSLEGLWDLRDRGLVTHLLEIKTNARVAEFTLAPEDEWSDGQEPEDLDEDWSQPGEAVRMPLRYVAQCCWSMGLSGLPWMTLRRLRFVNEAVRKALAAIDLITPLAPMVDAVLAALLKSKAAEIHTYRVDFDAETFDYLRELGLAFYVNHMLRSDNPPPVSKLEDLEAGFRLRFPHQNRPTLRQADTRQEALIEMLREASIAAKRADARLDVLKTLVKREIGEAPGIEAGAGKVSLSRYPGRTTVNAVEALEVFAEEIQTRCGKLPVEALSQARVIAMEKATTQGAQVFRLNAPQSWTKGLADQTFGQCAKEFGVEVVSVPVGE